MTGEKIRHYDYELDLINRIRERENVPEHYEVYIDYDALSFDETVKKVKPDFKKVLHRISEDDEGTKFELTPQRGVVRGDYFIVVECIVDSTRGQLTKNYIFTDDYEKFYKEYIYHAPKKEKEVRYGAGAYKIVHTMMGSFLNPVELHDTIPPILNDNLAKKLKDEIKMFKSKREIYDKLGLQYKRGVLLYGKAGCGKTMFIRNLMKDLPDAISIITDGNSPNDLDYLSKMCSDKYYKDVLKILVMEDIDGMESNMRSMLLNFLDGLEPLDNVLIIATTNFPERLDIAIRNRPSRFDSMHEVELPNKETRKKLLKRYYPNMKNGELVECATQSKGFTGAYFKEVFVLSKLNDMTALESIQEIKKRFKKWE